MRGLVEAEAQHGASVVARRCSTHCSTTCAELINEYRPVAFADSQTNGTNTTGSGNSGAHNGSDNTAADTELDQIPQELDEHPDTYSAADINAEMNPPKWDRYTDVAEPGASRAPP